MMQIKAGEPVAWLVFCPDGHEFDYITFGEQEDAKSKAVEFLDDSDDATWNVYPLFVGLEPIVVG